jgi:hypothetical protein
MYRASVSDCRVYFGLLGKVLLLSVHLGLFLRAEPCLAEEPPNPGEAEHIDFKIPAQPLGSALAAFGAATGFEIIADARFTHGRTSSPVIGSMRAHEALLLLLADTGLTIRNYTPGSVRIMLAPRPAETRFSPERSAYASYFAAVQQTVLQAICAQNTTRPGGYRLALKLWLSASGAVRRVKFLGTSGDRQRDTTLVSALQRADIGQAPPAGFAQPVTLVIGPQLSTKNHDCQGAGGKLSHAHY